MPDAVKLKLDGLSERAVEVLAEALNGDDPRLRFAASQEVLNRVYGKPVTPASVDVKTTDLNAAHLASLIALAAAPRATIDAEVVEMPALTHSGE